MKTRKLILLSYFVVVNGFHLQAKTDLCLDFSPDFSPDFRSFKETKQKIVDYKASHDIYVEARALKKLSSSQEEGGSLRGIDFPPDPGWEAPIGDGWGVFLTLLGVYFLVHLYKNLKKE